MITFTDIKFEQANILYNIGCLHSKLGSMDNRMSPEVHILIKFVFALRKIIFLFFARLKGMKISCTHFQCSAWMFQHLKETFESFKCLDFNRDFLSFMSTTMLVCIFISILNFDFFSLFILCFRHRLRSVSWKSQ